MNSKKRLLEGSLKKKEKKKYIISIIFNQSTYSKTNILLCNAFERALATSVKKIENISGT